MQKYIQMSAQYLSIGKSAKFLGVSIDTLRRWEKKGKIVSRRLDGKNRYFKISDLERKKHGKFLTSKQVADRLAISVATLQRLSDEGVINVSKDDKGYRKYKPEDIEKYLSSQEQVVRNAKTKAVSESEIETEVAEVPTPTRTFFEISKKTFKRVQLFWKLTIGVISLAVFGTVFILFFLIVSFMLWPEKSAEFFEFQLDNETESVLSAKTEKYENALLAIASDLLKGPAKTSVKLLRTIYPQKVEGIVILEEEIVPELAQNIEKEAIEESKAILEKGELFINLNQGVIGSSVTINKSPTVSLSGDVLGSATLSNLGSTTLAANVGENVVGNEELIASGVTAGDYTHTSITVDANGRITSASSGSDSDTTYSAGSGLTLSSSYFKLGGSLSESTTVTQGAYNFIFNLTSTGDFKVQDNGSDVLVIDDSGTLKTTTFQLTASPAAGYVLTSDASGVAGWTDTSSTAGPWTLSGSNLYPDDTSYSLAIGATDAGTADLYVAGNVSIGTTSPTGTLHVVNTDTALSGKAALIVDQEESEDIFTASASGSPVFVIDESGNVGIGTTDPQGILHLNGGTGSLATGLIFGDGDSGIYENSDDQLYVNSGGTLWRFVSSLAGFAASNYPVLRAATPSFTLPVLNPNNQDLDTGIGWAGADILSLVAGGANGLNVNSSGNVGIGTTGPSSPAGAAKILAIEAVSPSLVLSDTGTGTPIWDLMAYSQNLYVEDDGQIRARFDSSGRFAIGSAAPLYQLDVSGIIRSTTGAYFATTSGSVGIGTTDPVSTLDLTGTAWLRGAAADQGLYVNASGYVGIGTTGPSEKLHIVDGKLWIDRDTSSSLVARFSDNSTPSSAVDIRAVSYRGEIQGINSGNAGVLALNPDGGNIVVGATNPGTAKLYVNGSVGIGTTDPKVAMHVYDGSSGQSSPNSYARLVVEDNLSGAINILGPSSSFGAIFFGDQNDNDAGGIIYDHVNNDLSFRSNGTSDQLVINSSGNVGIGTTSPTDTLHVVGNILATTGVHIGTDDDTKLIDDDSNDSSSATLYIGNETIDTSISDIRLKENVALSEIDALSLINSMNIYDFDWVEGTARRERGRSTGLIAQEVFEYLPQVVKKGANEESLWAVEYQHLVPYALKGIQELDSRLMIYDSRISRIESLGGDAFEISENGELANTLDLPEEENAEVVWDDYLKKDELEGIAYWNHLVWTFVKDTLFKMKVVFEGVVEFVADVSFGGKIKVSRDTAGILEIPAGATKVKVFFETEFESVPFVMLTPEDGGNVVYRLEQVTESDFILSLAQEYDQPLKFTWLALVKDDMSLAVEILESRAVGTEPSVGAVMSSQADNEIGDELDLESLDLETSDASSLPLNESNSELADDTSQKVLEIDLDQTTTSGSEEKDIDGASNSAALD